MEEYPGILASVQLTPDQVSASQPDRYGCRVVELMIQTDGSKSGGVHLLYVYDKGHGGDFWLESIEAAMESAEEEFGIKPSDWKLAQTEKKRNS